MDLVGLLILLVVAAIAGACGEMIAGGKVPGGWIGSILAGLVAAGLGGYLITIGPEIGGIRIITAIIGAALFVLIPDRAGMQIADMSRVIQGVVSGIGFLGAGAILKLSEQGIIKGLTTAAGIWMTAAIGVAVGLGSIGVAVLSTIFAVGILSWAMRLERRIDAKPAAEADSKAADGRG